jgi:hypothetical protein
LCLKGNSTGALPGAYSGKLVQRDNMADEPKGRVFWVSTLPPQNTRREPYFRFNSAGSIPAAEHCTGLAMSNPASTKLSRNRSTLPQECLKHFQLPGAVGARPSRQ